MRSSSRGGRRTRSRPAVGVPASWTASFVASVSRYEDFLAPSGRLPRRAPDDALRAIAAANGIRVVGPPGELPAARGESAA